MTSEESLIITIISVISMIASLLAIMYDSENGTLWYNASNGQKAAKVFRAMLLLGSLVTLFATVIIMDSQSVTERDKQLVETLEEDYGISISFQEAESFRSSTTNYKEAVKNGFYTLGTVRHEELNYAILANEEGDIKVYLILSDKMQRVSPQN